MKISGRAAQLNQSFSSESSVTLVPHRAYSSAGPEGNPLFLRAAVLSVELLVLISMGILVRRGFRYLRSLTSLSTAKGQKSLGLQEVPGDFPCGGCDRFSYHSGCAASCSPLPTTSSALWICSGFRPRTQGEGLPPEQKL